MLDLSQLADWLASLFALGAVMFLIYGGWLVFQYHYPQRPAPTPEPEPEPEPLVHSIEEVPHH